MAGPCWSSRPTVRKTPFMPRSVSSGLVAEPEITGMPALRVDLGSGNRHARIEVPDHRGDLRVDELLRHQRADLGIALVVLAHHLEGDELAADRRASSRSPASIASATPFSSSLPWCAIEPVSGPACAERHDDGVGAARRRRAAPRACAQAAASSAQRARRSRDRSCGCRLAVVQQEPAPDHAVEVPDVRMAHGMQSEEDAR